MAMKKIMSIAFSAAVKTPACLRLMETFLMAPLFLLGLINNVVLRSLCAGIYRSEAAAKEMHELQTACISEDVNLIT
jgi:hypothetical protein